MKINNSEEHNALITLPEWKAQSLFLVWPGGLEGRGIFEKAYYYFISLLPEDIEVHVITNNESQIERIKSVFTKRRPACRVFFHIIPQVMDIWIRDWAPITVRNENGDVSLVKAKYRPRYIPEKDVRFAEGDDAAGRSLADITESQIYEIQLVWDIGNFTHNGNGTAIVTNRIKDDNPYYDDKSIRELFRENLGIEKIIFIDEEPGDVTGHVDGTVRFMDEKTIAVAKYPEDHIQENEYCYELVETLKNNLGEGFAILRIPNGPIEDLVSEGMPSAKGNHLNFLRIGNYLFMPCYGDKEDEQAIEVIKTNLPAIHVIPVEPTISTAIARKGGVLDCISWAM